MDSRESREGEAIRRRRECLKCGRRFTSYERLEEVPILIVKKDGRREAFERQKLLRGLMAACQKRPVSLSRLEEVAADIQARLMEHVDREIPSRQLGELVMDALKAIDSVAYVRFASVYRDFKDLPDFVKALEGLMGSQASPSGAPVHPVAPCPIQTPASEPSSGPSPESGPALPAPMPEPPVEKSHPKPVHPKPEASPLHQTPLFPGMDPDSSAHPSRRKSK